MESRPPFAPSSTRLVVVIAILAAVAIPRIATAQPSERVIAEEPTGGIHLPATPLAGDHDATAVSANPAGLLFLGSSYLGLAIDFDDEDTATTVGPGVGLFWGSTLGGRVLPKVGIGVGLEFMRSSRVTLSPDPGEATRLSLAIATPLGRHAALGVAWRRYFDDGGGSLSGVSSWDVGFTSRAGAHWAAGFVVRDVNAPTVAGVPVQRRYELEVTSRPVGTDRLELALGGRIGERRADIDAWLRWSVRLLDGVYFKGRVGTRQLHIIERGVVSVVRDFDEREYFLSAGLELSLGSMGVETYGTSLLNADRDIRFGGGTLIARISAEQKPSLLPARKRIERIEISGGLSQKSHTAAIATLRRIARDPDVVALFVKLDGVAVGWATARELHNQLLAVRAAGKRVFAYMVTATARDYFIASAADKVYIDPAGGVRLSGFSGTTIYFKGLFDMLGVNAQFEKIEEYKSAPEQFTRTGPTEPALRMRNELYDSLFDSLVEAIASARNLSKAKVLELIDKGPFVAGDLENSPLIDAVATPDEIEKLVTDVLGGRYVVSGRPFVRPERWAYPAIAVVHIEGDIVDGKSNRIPVLGRRLVGSATITAAIRSARANPRVKAIILRIDSPGGSAVASEMISREVFKTRGVKPIVCSMGDVAASGGYFAAAGCDVIFADPMTVTGSIGIFYGKIDVSSLLTKLGISWQTFKRGKRADMDSYFRPYSDEERGFIKERIRYLYGRFTAAVAKGRGMKQAEVDAVGRGRVWSGAAAKKVNLVDHLGGLSEAIDYAKKAAGMGKHELATLLLLPRTRRGLLSRLTGLPGILEKAQDKDDLSGFSWIPGSRAIIEALPASLLAQPQAAQARLPFAISWE